MMVLITDGVCYVLLTPEEHPQPLKPSRIDKLVAHGAMWISYALSVMRLPFAIVPYLTKLLIFLLAREHFYRWWRDSYPVQLVRLIGDVVNLPLTAIVLREIAPDGLRWVVDASMMAEGIRLISEKGQMLISAGWQMLPHREMARWVQSVRWLPMMRYAAYYALDDDQRMGYVLRSMRERAAMDSDAARRFGYTVGFRIVPESHGLRAGHVRDVARGEVFIHRRWTNDPFLLIGQAMRRGAWLFDPRYLRRPFRYRSESNRIATLFVLTCARYAPPFGWYQFGHEIKVARYSAYHRVLRWVGITLEQPIRQDGTYVFDQVLWRIGGMMGWTDCEPTPSMRSDAEVIVEIGGEELSTQEIAERYSYPLCYVEEVLMPMLYARNAAAISEAVASGASQCG
jgi:hypothetical protein